MCRAEVRLGRTGVRRGGLLPSNLLGFRVTLESQAGSGGADLLLERDELRIGVEISVTTGTTHEVENVLKCLSGTFSHVAFITADVRKQEQVRARVLARVAERDADRVGFYQVEAFVDYLRALPQHCSNEGPPPRPAELKGKTLKGWTVKTKSYNRNSEELREKEDQALRAIAEALRQPPSTS